MKQHYLVDLWCVANIGWAQAEEVISAKAQPSELTAPKLEIAAQRETDIWLNEMSLRLKKHIPDTRHRIDFLSTLRYEATRAGLDPQLVLSLIEVQSNFNQYAESPTGAKGYMQVMPFWIKVIGKPDHDLFNVRTNLRYGCTILRHYVDIERGNLYRALGRYDGSHGKSEFPSKVYAALKQHWGSS